MSDEMRRIHVAFKSLVGGHVHDADGHAAAWDGAVVSTTSQFDGVNDLALIDIPGDYLRQALDALDNDPNVIEYRYCGELDDNEVE